MATPTKKDFVSTNITTNVMSVPKKPSPAYVDTVRGSKHPLESSGLVPKYIKEKVGGEGRGGGEGRALMVLCTRVELLRMCV